MSVRPFNVLGLGALACAVALAVSPLAAQSQPKNSSFALIPLVAGDLSIPYQIFPSASERNALGNKLATRVTQMDGGVAIAPAKVSRALEAAGFDQNSQYRQCDTAACARKIGQALHVDTVVYGSVTRAMAMIWGTEVSLVDVASGRVRGPYSLGYKGDYTVLETGVDALAQAVSTRLIADAAERTHARALAGR